MASDNSKYTTTEADAQGHVAAHAGTTKALPTTVTSATTITVVDASGTESTISTSEGQTT